MGFTWGSVTISNALIIYIVLSVCQGLYIAKYMYMQNKPVSAMITVVLLILVFYFFGKRWFQYGQLKGSKAWVIANAVAQSGSSPSTKSFSSTGLGAQGQSGSPACAAAAASTPPSTIWPPIVNHCPDFMVLQQDGSCADTAKLYGTTAIGQTVVPAYKGQKDMCSSVSTDPTKNQYLRWEGVVQAEGSCSPGNIGKSPSA
jgi:hypothetical protein